MTTITPHPTEEQVMVYTGSLELKDGPLHFVQDPEMYIHYGGYHAQTNTIFYGGLLEMADPLTARIGQRYIRIQHGDRTEMVSKFAEQCDAWHTIDDTSEMKAAIERLTEVPRILNPETRALIGTAAAQQYAAPEHEVKSSGFTVRLRLAEGVGLRSMPRGGWTLEADGSISDASGTVMFVRADQNRPAAPRPAGVPAPAPVLPPAPERGGVWGSIRRAFGGR